MKYLILSLLAMIPLMALADNASADLNSFTVVTVTDEADGPPTEVAYDSKSVKTIGDRKTVRVLLTYVQNKLALYTTISLNCSDQSFTVVEAYRVDRNQQNPELHSHSFTMGKVLHDYRLTGLFERVCGK